MSPRWHTFRPVRCSVSDRTLQLPLLLDPSMLCDVTSAVTDFMARVLQLPLLLDPSIA
jgi:hypothetical protein